MHSTPTSSSAPMTPSTGAQGRTEIATYRSYDEAQAAVDQLADAQFPVERLTIVAEGLRFVEQVLGRRGYKDAIVGGLFSGALLGAALGVFFGLFDWVQPLVSSVALAFYGLFLGGVVGAILGGVGHWMTAGRRDFSSIASMQAERYAVLCDAEAADEAGRLLGTPAR